MTTMPTSRTMAGTRYSESVPLSAIHPDPDQPRSEITEARIEQLADSIRLMGLKTPLTLRMRAEGGYWIVAGESRYLALRKLRRETAPAFIKNDLLDPEEAFEEAFISNLGEPMNPMDEAAALRRIFHHQKFGSNKQLARHLDMDEQVVTNRLLLLWLDDEDQRRVRSGQLPLTEAVAKARELTGRVTGPRAPKPTRRSRPQVAAPVTRGFGSGTDPWRGAPAPEAPKPNPAPAPAAFHTTFQPPSPGATPEVITAPVTATVTGRTAGPLPDGEQLRAMLRTAYRAGLLNAADPAAHAEDDVIEGILVAALREARG